MHSFVERGEQPTCTAAMPTRGVSLFDSKRGKVGKDSATYKGYPAVGDFFGKTLHPALLVSFSNFLRSLSISVFDLQTIWFYRKYIMSLWKNSDAKYD